jgi:hypothetical protein
MPTDFTTMSQRTTISVKPSTVDRLGDVSKHIYGDDQVPNRVVVHDLIEHYVRTEMEGDDE